MHVFEKNAKAGGLLRYGIPDFKMEKHLIDRRVGQMTAEGVTFHYNVNVGVSMPVEELTSQYDAVVLAGGSEKPRDLAIPGRDLQGIHFAMDFLPQQNRRVSHEPVTTNEPILASGKHVVVIGGGDTGSDCIGTSVRQGALSVTQLEIMPKPPEKENKLLTWPEWPLKMRTSSSHQEGAEREFAVNTVAFIGQGQVKQLRCVRVDNKFQPIPGSEFDIKADLVLLAMGFVAPIHEGMINSARRQARPARQRRRRHGALQVVDREGVRLRRHAARPVARRVGDPRRTPVRAFGGRAPDGQDAPAAVIFPDPFSPQAGRRWRAAPDEGLRGPS